MATNTNEGFPVTTLLGEAGEETMRKLSEITAGRLSVKEAGLGFSRADDGTVCLTVDRESYEAIFGSADE